MNEYMLKLFDDFLVGDGVLEPPLLLVVLEPAVPGDEGSSSSLKENIYNTQLTVKEKNLLERSSTCTILDVNRTSSCDGSVLKLLIVI
jgi:hypothetical protein